MIFSSGSNLLPLNLILHSLNSAVRRTTIPLPSHPGEKGVAFEVEGSDPYLTYLKQKNKINLNKYPTYTITLFYLLQLFFYEGDGGN